MYIYSTVMYNVHVHIGQVEIDSRDNFTCMYMYTCNILNIGVI